MQRLREIDASEDKPGTFLEIGGWPALEREFLAPLDRVGRERRKQDPVPLSRRFTIAVAVDNLLIQFQGHLMPEANPALIEEMRAIGRSFVFTSISQPEVVEEEIQGLRGSPRLLQPPRSFHRPALDDDPLMSRAEPEAAADGPGLVQRIQGGQDNDVDSEIEMAVSTDGRNIVVANNGREISTSNDGGVTFANASAPLGFAGGANGDPSLAYAASGAFYFAYIGYPGLQPDGSGDQCSTSVAASTDNGQNFLFRGHATICDDTNGPVCFPDQEHIAADRFNLSLNTGLDQVYSTWRNFSGGGCGRVGGTAIAGPDVPTLVCSEDGGVTWPFAQLVHGSTGTYPRINVGQDGSVYVVYREGSNNIRLAKFSSCDTGLVPQPSVAVATGITRVTCPIPGIDRCNDGSDLTSQMVAVDDTNANHVYVSYAVNTSNNVNENVIVQDSIDGGANLLSWIRPPVQVNNGQVGRRFMPWICTAGGTAYVSWYDMRASSNSPNDQTDYYGASAFLNDAGNLTAGQEFKISTVTDSLCGPSPGHWPCAPRSTGDSESCWDQPQWAGVCIDGDPNTADSRLRCDFTQGDANDNLCPAGETCQTGGGCPKYGDYSGNACAAGRFYAAWASRTSPPEVTPASNDIDVFYTSKFVCCEPQIQIPGPVDFGLACSEGPQTETLEVCNTGKEDLVVDPITSSSTDFEVVTPSAGWGFAISPDFCFPFKVTYTPSGTGDQSATLTIPTNDPVNPTVEVEVTATSGVAEIDTFIANSGDFGDVCTDEFHDLNLTIQNNGACDLEIDSVSLSGGDAADFDLPDGSLAGTILEPGNSLLIPVRFAPSNFTDPNPRTTSVIVASSTSGGDSLADDPTPIQGTSPPPDIQLAIAQFGDFGDVCKTGFVDIGLELFNAGKCDLTIETIELIPNNGSFELPDTIIFPLVLSPDADFTVPVRFAPSDCFDIAEDAVVRVTSDDPDRPEVDVEITGVSPCPNLLIDPGNPTGELVFPPTVVDTNNNLGCFSDRIFNLRNNGECPLTIDSISASGADFTLMEPSVFPIILPSGEETLGVKVRFTPQSDADPLAPSEVTGILTVVSDDPDNPLTGNLCGESVAQSGVRILVTDQSVPVPVPIDEVDSMSVQTKGINTPSPINLRFTDQPLSSANICGSQVDYHLDLEFLPATNTTGSNPKSSYEAKAKERNLQAAQSFGLDQCELREFQLQLEGSAARICLLLTRGEVCTNDAECCSNKCRGLIGKKICK
jgi:hypothetical protein